MLTWVIILAAWWLGYICGVSDDGAIGTLAGIPTILTIGYLCLVALGLV